MIVKNNIQYNMFSLCGLIKSKQREVLRNQILISNFKVFLLEIIRCSGLPSHLQTSPHASYAWCHLFQENVLTFQSMSPQIYQSEEICSNFFGFGIVIFLLHKAECKIGVRKIKFIRIIFPLYGERKCSMFTIWVVILSTDNLTF